MDDRDAAAEHDGHELDRLHRFSTRPGLEFALALAVFADPVVARRLREQAWARASAAGCRVTTLELGSEDAEADLVEELHRASSEAEVVFVTGIDALLTDTLGHPRRAAAVANLNLRRDQLPDRVPGRVVLWVSKRTYPMLARLAWDLLQVTLTRFEFESTERVEIQADYFKASPPTWLTFVGPDRVEETRAQAKRWLARAESSSNLTQTADATTSAALLFASAGDLDRARSLLNDATRLYTLVPDPGAAARQQIRGAELSLFCGDSFDAKIQAALALQYDEWSVEFDAWRLLADVATSDGDFTKARTLLEGLVDRCQARGDRHHLALSLAELGALQALRLGQFDDGVRALVRAAEIYRELGDERRWAQARTGLATAYMLAGRVDDALDIFVSEVVPALERVHDARELVAVRRKIALIHLGLREFSRALEILRNEVIPGYEALGDNFGSLLARLDLATVLAQRGDRDEAIELLTEHVIPTARTLGSSPVERLAQQALEAEASR